jgi:hypothetical protein
MYLFIMYHYNCSINQDILDSGNYISGDLLYVCLVKVLHSHYCWQQTRQNAMVLQDGGLAYLIIFTVMNVVLSCHYVFLIFIILRI